ncbi:MAG TPA: YafY family protein [Candidatus Dormibacteraeota bacterium]
MRASRLVSILLLLQVHGRLPASALAERLEVSVRTIYRDLDALGEAGVPVCTQGGAGGGCWLVEGYRTRLTGLTAEEAQALFLAGVPGPAGELGLGIALATAQLKVLAALPEELRARAGRARGRFHLDAPRWFRPPAGELAQLGQIAAAVWEDRMLEVCHRREGRPPVTRTVEALGLVVKAGVWYLVARQPPRDEPHVYRLSRILAATALAESFVRPAGFELTDFWSRWSRAFETSLPRVEVVARMAPHVVPRARAVAVDVTTAEPEPGGWVRATLTMERLEWAEGAILGLGPGVEVLEPVELRERVAASARAIADGYRQPS